MNVLGVALKKIKEEPKVIIYPLAYSLLNYAIMQEVLPTLKGVGENAFTISNILIILAITVLSYLYRVAYISLLIDFIKGGKFAMDIYSRLDVLKSMKLVVLDILIGLVFAIGALLLVIPGILWLVAVLIYPIVLVANDNMKIADIISGALKKTKGYRLQVFVLLVLITIANLMAMSLPYVLASFIDAFVSAFTMISFVVIYLKAERIDEA